jgi:hypothetical protein
MAAYISPVDRLIEDLKSGLRSIEDLDEDEVIEIRQALNPYGTAINLENNTGKYFAYSFINLREEYLKKFLMTSLIGYLFKRCDEWGVPDGDYVVPIEDFNQEQITREFIEENVVNGKVVLRQEAVAGVSGGENFSQEETAANRYRRMIISQFLNEMFTFNPDKHVRSAYKKNPEDKTRNKLKTKKKMGKYQKNPDDKVKSQLNEYDRTISRIPPEDTFYMLKNYMDNNYDALRLATNDIYAEKPDLDSTLVIYNDFPNEDKAREFINRHQNDVIADIRVCLQNQWTFQAAFRQNMDKLICGNTQTQVLQEILDAAQQNQTFAKDFLNKRIHRKKEQNIKECGPDDEAFIRNYKKDQAKDNKKKGLKHISAKERAQYELEKKYYNKYDKPSDDVKDEGIEVQTWTHDVKGRKMKPGHFVTKADQSDMERAKLISAD